MSDEPSLLDFLKALIDPRRERLRIADMGSDQSFAPHSDQQEEAVIDAPAAPIHRGPEELPETAGQEDVPPSVSNPVGTARGPLPWRTFSTVVLALAGQGALAPPARNVPLGVILYLAAIVLGALAFHSDEMPFPRLPRRRILGDDFRVSRTLLLSSIPILLLAFALLGGNRFTTVNLTFWLLGIGLLVFGLRARQVGGPGWMRRLKSLRPPYHITISPWAVLMIAAAFVILFFRFYHLAQVPSQMFSDHAEKLQDVQDVLNGETHIFFPRNTGREFFQMYLTAFTAKVLGYGLTFMALKMGTALAGLFTFPFIYLLGVELANRRVGFMAMVMAGISYWLNVITRVALRFSLYPLFVAPVFYFIVRGLRSGKRNDFIWAGIFLGLGLHGYSPFRFVPFLVVTAVVLFILHVHAGERRRQGLFQLGIVIAVSFAVFLPLLRFMTESDANRAIVLYRSLSRIGTVETGYPGNPFVIFVQNMARSMAMFAWDNGNTWVHSVVLRPALDVVSGALFYIGYFLLMVRYVRQRNWEDLLLVVSVPLLMLPSALSLAFPAENPSLNRSGGALVPVFLIAALTLDALLVSVRVWVGRRSGRIAAWSVVGLLLLWSGTANYDLVFHQYDEQFTASAWNTTELGQVIRGFADSIGTEDSAWVIPWPYWVDTRLVGINAGVYIRDYAIQREELPGTLSVQGPKLFIFNMEDLETRSILNELYPDGIMKRYDSQYDGKDFMVFTTLAP